MQQSHVSSSDLLSSAVTLKTGRTVFSGRPSKQRHSYFLSSYSPSTVTKTHSTPAFLGLFELKRHHEQAVAGVFRSKERGQGSTKLLGRVQHNGHEEIWAALPTSLSSRSGGPLLAVKFGWLLGLKVRLWSQTSETKGHEKCAKKQESTPANGVATSSIKKHTSAISWFVGAGGRRARADTVAERACQLEFYPTIGF